MIAMDMCDSFLLLEGFSGGEAEGVVFGWVGGYISGAITKSVDKEQRFGRRIVVKIRSVNAYRALAVSLCATKDACIIIASKLLPGHVYYTMDDRSDLMLLPAGAAGLKRY